MLNASPTRLKASSDSRDRFLSGCTILEVRWYAFLTSSGVASCASCSTAYRSAASMMRRAVEDEVSLPHAFTLSGEGLEVNQSLLMSKIMLTIILVQNGVGVNMLKIGSKRRRTTNEVKIEREQSKMKAVDL